MNNYLNSIMPARYPRDPQVEYYYLFLLSTYYLKHFSKTNKQKVIEYKILF